MISKFTFALKIIDDQRIHSMIQSSAGKQGKILYQSLPFKLRRDANFEYYDNLCLDSCATCKEGVCVECKRRKQFKYSNTCIDECPSGYLANNIDFTCEKFDREIKGKYLQEYSLSFCANRCYSEFKDCSCNSSCIQRGNCCSDYADFCKRVEKIGLFNKADSKCFIFSPKGKCLQCNSKNYYYYEGDCVERCPSTYLSNEENKLCVKIETGNYIKPLQSVSSIENCQQYKDEFRCLKCLRGYFLLKSSTINSSSCVKICPQGYIADKKSHECVIAAGNQSIEQIHFSVKPSKLECKGSCNSSILHYNSESVNIDCNCDEACIRRGDCCDDYFTYCYYSYPTASLDVNKFSNSISCNSNCQDCFEVCVKCKPNFSLTSGNECILENTSIIEPTGIIKAYNNSTQSNEASKLIPDTKIHNFNPDKALIQNLLSEQLSSLFINKAIRDLNNTNFFKNETLTDSFPMSRVNLVLNGNISINLVTGNDKPKIITQHIYNSNSYNKNANTTSNSDSFNKITKKAEA